MKEKNGWITALLAGALLVAIGVKFRQNRVPLDDRLVSSDDATRVEALRIYAGQSPKVRQPTVDALIARHVHAASPRERQFALYALRKSGLASEKSMEPMVDALGDSAPNVQQEAVVGLAEAGDAALPALVERLNGADDAGTSRTVELLARSPKAVPLLLPFVSDAAHPSRARHAADVIALLSAPEAVASARGAMPALTEDLKSKDAALAESAAFALHKVDPANAAPAPVLQRLVRADDWDRPGVRGWEAARALSEIPAAASSSLPVLSRALLASTDGFSDGKKYRRPYVAAMMEKLDPRPHQPSDLVWDLKSRDGAVRYRAVLAVGQSPAGKEALMPALLNALKDSDAYIAARALWALEKIGLENTVPLGPAAARKISAALGELNDHKVEGFEAAVGEPARNALKSMAGSVGGEK